MIETVRPGSFSPEKHFYTKVLNANLHPLVAFFLRLNPERIINRYCHLNPQVDKSRLEQELKNKPTYFRWAGSDLFYVTTAEGRREMLVIETNSCPSGQKSMPLQFEHIEQGGYQALIEGVVGPLIKAHRLKKGRLAVVYDKNPMENSGYAAVLADYFAEDVFLVQFNNNQDCSHIRFEDGIMQIKPEGEDWIPLRAVFRYVTQSPWNRIPHKTKTLIINPIITCLAGGRNKLVAAKAYDLYNADLAPSGLSIVTPETISDVKFEEIPMLVQRFGGHAVVKVPYSNAGQGVYTITCPAELEQFMNTEQRYDSFIVQSLIGNASWSSIQSRGLFYHVGTVPNKKNQIFVADLRMMVMAGEKGFEPLAIYGRKARKPLEDRFSGAHESWDMLGTNLSVKTGPDSWDTDSSRLLLMDRKDFNSIGIGLDELIKGYIQTVLSINAIDQMSKMLVTTKGSLRKKLYQSLNSDPAFLSESMLS